MISGLGRGLDYCWSWSRTKGLEKQSVLVSKKLSDFGLKAGGLDYNTDQCRPKKKKKKILTSVTVVFFSKNVSADTHKKRSSRR